MNTKKEWADYMREYRKGRGGEVVRAWARRNREQVRQQVISLLGGVCICCGESRSVFLEIDHIFNDGHKDVRGTNRYLRMRKTILGGDTTRHQVLCANCHTAKMLQVVCPHKS